jgi:hypothetical protein
MGETLCMICLEKIDDKCVFINEETFSSGVTNHCKTIYYKTMCPCNILLHRECMEEWIRKNPSCPICLVRMEIYKPRHVVIFEMTVYFLWRTRVLSIVAVAGFLFYLIVVEYVERNSGDISFVVYT